MSKDGADYYDGVVFYTFSNFECKRTLLVSWYLLV